MFSYKAIMLTIDMLEIKEGSVKEKKIIHFLNSMNKYFNNFWHFFLPVGMSSVAVCFLQFMICGNLNIPMGKLC